MWEKALSAALNDDLSERKKKNPRYSSRAYSKHLGLAPATLSEILRGSNKWSLRKERALKIIEKMGISAGRKNKLLALMGVPPLAKRENLKFQDYDLLTDWAYSAVLFAHGLPKELRGSEKLSERFGLDQERVDGIIAHLLKKNLLRKSDDGKTLEGNPVDWFAEKAPPARVVRKHHKNNLGLAIRSIEGVPPEKRDLSALTFCGSLKKIDEIRKEIRIFHEKVMHLMDQGEENDQVIRLSVALFPLQDQMKENTP